MLIATPSVVLLNVLSGVCVLLWGLRSVKVGDDQGLRAGPASGISWGTKNRIGAFFSGIGVTALLQSLTATALIVWPVLAVAR